MDGSHLLHSGYIHPSSRSQCIPFYGCQPLWMGCSSQTDKTVLLWSLDKRSISAQHEYSRNNGHSFCVEKGHTPLLCHDVHRQHNSSLICQQTRRNTFSQSMYRSMGNPPLVPGTQCDSQNSSHFREIQHSCGPSVEMRQASIYGMVKWWQIAFFRCSDFPVWIYLQFNSITNSHCMFLQFWTTKPLPWMPYP